MKSRFSRRAFIRSGIASPVLTSSYGASPTSYKGFESTTSVRFAVASDGHYGQPETDYERFHREMIEWLNQEVAGRGLDFVVFNGDIIHDRPEFLPQVKAHFDKLEVPYKVNKGNHDMATEEVWQRTWGNDINHAFERGETGFLLGTTSNEKGEYLCANVDWIRDRLADFKDKTHILIFLHISQHGITRHGISCAELGDLIEANSNVTALFHGHDHDIDNVIYSKKRPLFFDGHMGGSWGTNYRGYRIVEVSADSQITTYQCNPAAFYENHAVI